MSTAIPQSPSLALWLLAIAPVVALLALVLWGRLPSAVSALATVAAAVVIGMAAFGAGPAVVLVGLGKGAWVGVWILYVIWPALLVHHLTSHFGMTALGRFLGSLSPCRTDTVLLLAWVLPSFIQGISGFGTPIALCAPLLVALGVDGVRAVALPLIGYHWAVGFGSVGSSFYMGSLTAQLNHDQAAAFAGSLAIVLGLQAMLAGVLVAAMYAGRRGLRESWPLLVTVGPAMALSQAVVVRGIPAVGALCAGAVGIATFLAVQRLRSRRVVAVPAHVPHNPGPAHATAHSPGPARVPEQVEAPDGEARRRALAAAIPHVALTVLALAVFVPPVLRGFVRSHVAVGPSFPSTRTTDGVSNAAVVDYSPIALLGHPGTFLLAACAVGVIAWRALGMWRPGTWRAVGGPWLRQAVLATPSVILLAAIAGVLVDTGMVRTVAIGAATVAGGTYPAFAPLVGALGSFVTGSTTSSNALFSALQRDVAVLIGEQPADLLAAQTAGGNIGNSLAPVVALLGLSAIGASRSQAAVARKTLLPALVLLVTAMAATVMLVLMH